MGQRTLKRVALDFDWPQGEIWKGYVNPYPGPLQCNACEGSGYNPATKQIADAFYDHDGGWRYDYGIAPDRHFLIEARAKRLGVYGKCVICNGNGELPHPNEAVCKLHDEWQESEPPAGDGYQLWETTSEGRPISPVFDTAEKLAGWCEDNAAVFADKKWPKQRWLEMFTADTGSVS